MNFLAYGLLLVSSHMHVGTDVAAPVANPEVVENIQIADPSDGCQRVLPTLRASGVHTLHALPAVVTFVVQATNHDDPRCDRSAFILKANVPQGWDSHTFPKVLHLEPGQTKDVQFVVYIPPGVPNNLYVVALSTQADDAHEESYTSTASVVVQQPLRDNTPPEAPRGLSFQMSHGGAGVALKWQAVADVGSGVSHYQVLCNGVVVGVTDRREFTSFGPRGVWMYSIQAVDRAGLVSKPSKHVRVRF